MSFDLNEFTLSDMTRLGADLRKLGAGATSMEEAAQSVVSVLHRTLTNGTDGAPACALVRVFVLLPFSSLDGAQQAFARRLLPDIDQEPGTKCLTLLATAGDEPAWNSRLHSLGHQALPIPGEESLARSPMIRQLMGQLGVDVQSLFASDPEMIVDGAQHTFNVFHVPDAQGSPHIPAQEEFVLRCGIRSVIGFGGLLFPGELFAGILFTKTPVTRQVAELFKTLALNVKVALLPFAGRRVFS